MDGDVSHRRCGIGGEFGRAPAGGREPPGVIPTPPSVAIVARASGTERANRSSFGTTSVSPARTAARA